MSKKLENTRIVTFEEDYKPAKRVIYKKGETHAIHFSIVEKLQDAKVKIKVAEFDEKKEVAKAKEEFEKQNKK